MTCNFGSETRNVSVVLETYNANIFPDDLVGIRRIIADYMIKNGL